MQTSSTMLAADDQKQLETLLAGIPNREAMVAMPDCNTYKTYRPILQMALPLIEKIPYFGSKIGTALSFLMTLADGVCSVTAANVSPAKASSNLPGKITVDKINANEVRVTFPQGTNIASNDVSEADLYFALSRNLLLSPSGSNPTAKDCTGLNF
jgi:hypothetical protein